MACTLTTLMITLPRHSMLTSITMLCSQPLWPQLLLLLLLFPHTLRMRRSPIILLTTTQLMLTMMQQRHQ
jgi:hypothetical protein